MNILGIFLNVKALIFPHIKANTAALLDMPDPPSTDNWRPPSLTPSTRDSFHEYLESNQRIA